MDRAVCENVAAALLDEIGLDVPPIDSFEIAAACGLRLIPKPGNEASLLPDGILQYPVRARHVRQRSLVARELGRWALRRAGEKDSDEEIVYVAGALVLPRHHFDQDLFRTSWDLHQLQAKHIHASTEMIARRLVNLRDAVATIFDQGRVQARFASPWLADRFKRVSEFEKALAIRCLWTERVQRADQLVWAFPVIGGSHRRVIMICDAEQLSLRL